MDLDEFAIRFVGKLDSGDLDGKLCEEMSKLSVEQLLKICRLLAQRERSLSGSHA